MTMFHQTVARNLRLISLLALLTGCASGNLMKIENEKNLPQELPRDLQDKFEVKDEVEVGVQVKKQEAPISLKGDGPQKGEPLAVEGSSLGAKKRVALIEKKKKRFPQKKQKVAKVSADAGQALSQEKGADSDTKKPAFIYPVRRPQKSAIWIGEKQVYEVSYFGVNAGDFTVKAQAFKTLAARKVYHVEGTAVSSSVFSMFYRLNDKIESYIDYDGLFSHRFRIMLDESKQARDALELNDSEKGQTFYWNRWQRHDQPYIETKEYFPISPFSQDSLSALYYLRSVPLPDGAVITFPVINEGKTWDAVVTVLRREMVDSPMGKVRAVVLRPESKYQGILKKQGENLLWLTDDDRKFMLRLEAKVKIGTVVAKLKEVELGTPPTPSPLE